MGEQSVKASREVHVGEIISARTGPVRRTIRVLALLERRIGARLVPDYLEDLTPPAEYARAAEESARAARFAQGSGRPTKKQRRQLLGLWDPSPSETEAR